MSFAPAFMPDSETSMIPALPESPFAVDVDGFWRSCLQTIEQMVPYSSCSLFFDIDGLQPRRTRHHVVPDDADPTFEPADSLSVAGPYLELHPYRRLYTFDQIVRVDPEAPQRWQVQEPGRHWDQFAHLAFWRDGKLDAVLGIGWSSHHARINGEDLTRLERLYPLLESGLSHLHTLQSERLRRQGLERALEHAPQAVMVIGLDGRLLFANDAAQRQCEYWNAALDHRSRGLSLPDCIDDVLEACRGCERSGHNGDGERYRIVHPRLPQLTASVSLRWDHSGLNRLPCYVLIFDTRSSVCSAGGNQHTEVLSKLSPRERRVALMAAEGLRNQEIAQRLSRSPRTIEYQIASVYRKLELGGRPQLIRLLG